MATTNQTNAKENVPRKGMRIKKMTTTLTTVYFADCDQFDNHRTGYYATAEEAIAAFWAENRFSKSEREEVRVYARPVAVDDDRMEDAKWLLSQGSPSPALGFNL